jgi:tRNA pseudouridine38-40 synthase
VIPGQEEAVRTFKLTLAYDGTAYVGWQRQRNGVSIQAQLEDALAPLAGGPVRTTGAGRTDAGVHALGQVASCRFETGLDAAGLQRALNARLPPDIRVVDAAEAPADFHARYWARGKLYVYRVLNAPNPDPLARHIVWHVHQPLDAAAMSAALAPICGRHDFKAFQASGSRVPTTVRTLTIATVERRPWNGVLEGTPVPAGATHGAWLITFRFGGDGFLRHMVRNLVGTVVEIGAGRRDPESLWRILEGRSRRLAGATAPPHGLALESVAYGDGPAPRAAAR